jgi:hypothetical protein
LLHSPGEVKCGKTGAALIERRTTVATNVFEGDNPTVPRRLELSVWLSGLAPAEEVALSPFSPLFFPGIEADEISILLSIDPAPFRFWAFCLGSRKWRFEPPA